jgi:hypothetical protein
MGHPALWVVPATAATKGKCRSFDSAEKRSAQDDSSNLFIFNDFKSAYTAVYGMRMAL